RLGRRALADRGRREVAAGDADGAASLAGNAGPGPPGAVLALVRLPVIVGRDGHRNGRGRRALARDRVTRSLVLRLAHAINLAAPTWPRSAEHVRCRRPSSSRRRRPAPTARRGPARRRRWSSSPGGKFPALRLG